MIQDISPYKLYNPYRPELRPCREDFIAVFRNNALLLCVDEANKTVAYPKAALFDAPKDAVYLFSIEKAPASDAATQPSDASKPVEKERFFLISDESLSIPAEYRFYEMNQVRKWNLYPRRYVFAAFTALQLGRWYTQNTFCGKCGSRTKRDDKERMLYCPSCGNQIYPRINPAVIVGVKNGDRLLITRYRTGFAHNALIAGFTEIGETLEETVHREVMEEAGIRIKNIRYYKSQPWGIADDILAGFYCEVDGDDTIRMDSNELKYAEWVPRSEIELQPLDYSLTNEMMQKFRDGEIL